MKHVARGLRSHLLPWVLGLLFVSFSANSQTQLGSATAESPIKPTDAVGEVVSSRGVGFAQSAGQVPRTLGVGLPLNEGDRLTTAPGGSAILKLKDGTRMTLRPESDLVLQTYRYQAGAESNGMVLELLRGGFRAITGLVTKSSGRSAVVKTATATIGIRGTDFDARLCGPECANEVRGSAESVRAANMRASAKIVAAQGDIVAVSDNGDRRRLVDGGSVYPGDLVETSSRSKAVLAFRDESRVSLGGGTRFRVDEFVFDSQNPSEGRFFVSLLKGTVRALTGLIGKAQTRNVSFVTPTATIGIRGTGIDLSCEDSGCNFFTWLGSMTVQPNGQTALQVLQAGQGLFVSPTFIRPITDLPLPDIERPDAVPIDMGPLFTGTPVDGSTQGLYVFVRDGHIELTTPNGGVLHLGKGEVGFADGVGRALRPLQLPLFIDLDPIPLPNTPNPLLTTVLEESGVRSSNQCRR